MFIRIVKSAAHHAMFVSMLALIMSGSASALVAALPSAANHSQCSDGIDNDHDSKEDYPQDVDCVSLDDDFEGVSQSGLFVTVSDGKESTPANSSLHYTVSLRQQRDDVRTVDVYLHLPAQVNFSTASDGGVVRDGIVHWDNISVSRNNTVYLSVHANLLPYLTEGTLLVARVLADGSETTDTTMVSGVGSSSLTRQFAVGITDGQATALPGDTLSYQIRVQNLSETTNVTNVQVPLPSLVAVTDRSGDAELISDKIIWKNVSFAPNQEKSFFFTVKVAPHVHKFASIHMRVTAGSISAVDDTLLYVGTPQGSLSADITDGRNSAARGQIITYTITLRNYSDRLATNGVVGASLPVYGEFVSATEGGRWDGNGVHWQRLQVAPNGQRTLSYSVRVRSDAPDGAVLRAAVTVQGTTASDTTTVSGGRTTTRQVNTTYPQYGSSPVYTTGSHDYDYTTTSSTGYTPYPTTGYKPLDGKGMDVLFRKSAGQGEALPGSNITYTLFVRNTLGHSINNAVISDRFDSSLLSIVRADGALRLGDGQLQWNVPSLAPGESWTTTYVLKVSRNAPKGTVVQNIATISGSDLRELSLSARVNVTGTGVVRTLPKTGGAMDALFLLVTAPLALASAVAQRRLKSL